MSGHLSCTCDYSGQPDEPHKLWCEQEYGPHADCRTRIDMLETEIRQLRASATVVDVPVSDPPVWWSPSHGVVQASATGFGYSVLAGYKAINGLPPDAIPLAPTPSSPIPGDTQ